MLVKWEKKGSILRTEVFCPSTHKIVEVLKGNGEVWKVEMCPELPVENVQARNDGQRNSDEEFIARLNLAFKLAGKNTQFRRATAAEYIWADSSGGKNPRRNDPELVRYAKYRQANFTSSNTPNDWTLLPGHNERPSLFRGYPGVKDLLPNILGFYRSGVWEWTETRCDPRRHDLLYYDLIVVGGSSEEIFQYAVSGIRQRRFAHQGYGIGSARLVRTQSDFR